MKRLKVRKVRQLLGVMRGTLKATIKYDFGESSESILEEEWVSVGSLLAIPSDEILDVLEDLHQKTKEDCDPRSDD